VGSIASHFNMTARAVRHALGSRASKAPAKAHRATAAAPYIFPPASCLIKAPTSRVSMAAVDLTSAATAGIRSSNQESVGLTEGFETSELSIWFFPHRRRSIDCKRLSVTSTAYSVFP